MQSFPEGPTGMDRSPSHPVRFGVFEFDPRAGELRKQGMKIKLQGQPIEILTLLLEHPGDIVTREKLQKKLWPSDTFVDFEHSLNAAVKRLRDALDDSADTPRYIETVARRGYRFIGPIDRLKSVSPRPRALKWVGIGSVAALALLAAFVGLNVGGWRDRIFRAGTKPIRSIAILPLANLSGDPEQDYFAEGMTEALISELGKISALRVISRQSMMQYKGTKKSAPQIARELNVEAVVEGSVLRAGDRVRISVQLIEAAPERHLWANSYDRELRGILALQSEVARAITSQIEAKVTPQELAQLTSTRSVNPEAYQLYLQGRYFMLSVSKEDFLRKGSRYLEDSVAKDPNYAPAYSALAFTYAELATFGYDPPWVGFPRARMTALKALELDENLGEAHAVLGRIKFVFDWDWSGAQKEERRALELSPNSSDAHTEYGFYLAVMGRSDEAITQIQKALELDPVPVFRTVNMGWCNLMARRYDDAIVHLKRAVELNPDYPAAHMELAWAYARKGMRAEANAEYEKTRRFVPAGKDQLLDAWLAPTYVLHDKRNEGLKLADWWGHESKRRHVDSYLVAALYVQLGVKERALDWLERGFEQHSPIMLGLKAEPFVDSLRSDPRFQDLLRRMNFPP